MKNIFAITFGTSDIQFNRQMVEGKGYSIRNGGNNMKLQIKDIEISIKKNRERNDFFLLNSPRIDGEIVYNNIKDFLPIIDLPLTLPVIEHIKRTRPDASFNYWFLVDTNQDKEKVKEIHWKNDTLFVSQIFKAKIQYLFPDESDEKFKFFTISEDLTNIDKHYLDFRNKCPEIFDCKEDEINRIFLLPQGGIDQINQALTLQLIQAFKTRVSQWQQAEDADPKELKFTRYFLKDLNKQKILKNIEDYEFGLIDNMLTDDKVVLKLCKYADLRLTLNHNQTACYLQELKKYFNGNILFDKISLKFNGNKIYADENVKLKDLYLSAKIKFYQRKYSDFLWRIFTLAENIYKIELEKYFDTKLMKFYSSKLQLNDVNLKWINFLNNQDNGIVEYLNKKGIFKSNPSRKALQKIHEYLIYKKKLVYDDQKQKAWKNVYIALEKLADTRNKIAHELSALDFKQKNNILPKNYTIEMLISDFDTIIGVSGFDIYDLIKDEIIKRL